MSVSERAQEAEVLARCVLCTRDGPAPRLQEHMTEDHTDPRPTHGFVVSVAPRLREPLQRLAETHHLTVGALITAAVDNHFGRLAR